MRTDLDRRACTFTTEVREQGNTLTMEGYASTFEQPYDMGWYTETVDPAAFRKTLAENPDVRLLINHEGLPLARTRSGTLQLSTDSVGLHMRATLDRNDPDVQSLAPKMARGDLDQMSFGFRTVSDVWDDKYTERRLTELRLDNGDVSVVTYPANPSTSVGLRAMFGDIARGGELPFTTMLLELRAGKVLSQANVDLLGRVLDSLALIDASIDTADEALDQAQADLSGLLGVPNPDPAEPDDMQMNAAPPLLLMRAQAQRLALAARHL